MSRRQVNVIVVCEDTQQWTFIYQYLLKRGFNGRKIRKFVNPKGIGSGEQYVRDKLVKEIKEYRRLRHKRTNDHVVIGMIDADNRNFDSRIGQINSSLSKQGADAIAIDERIAIFVPKRNIETWLQYAETLSEVDEDKSYPKRKKTGCKTQVAVFVDKICAGELPHDAPSSIQVACSELAKIL